MRHLFSFLLACLTFFVIVYSCSKDNEPTETISIEQLTDEKVNQLVKKFNNDLFRKFGVATPDIKKGFSFAGSIEADILEKEDHSSSFLAVGFREFDTAGNQIQATRLNVGLFDDLEFPEKIETARVVFLGNELIITNLNTGQHYNFLVKVDETVVSRVSEIETINSSYLAIEKVNETESANLLGSCQCECVSCGPSPQSPCQSSGCSCGCGNQSCSIDCYPNYNAVCGGCGGEQ